MTVEDIPEDLVITCRDIVAAGMCARGQREWARSNGIDFREFIRTGLPARTLFAADDAFALKAVTETMRRRA